METPCCCTWTTGPRQRGLELLLPHVETLMSLQRQYSRNCGLLIVKMQSTRVERSLPQVETLSPEGRNVTVTSGSLLMLLKMSPVPEETSNLYASKHLFHGYTCHRHGRERRLAGSDSIRMIRTFVCVFTAEEVPDEPSNPSHFVSFVTLNLEDRSCQKQRLEPRGPVS